MKSKKSLILLGVLVVVALIALAGCGQSASTTASTTQPAAGGPAAGPAATPAAAPATQSLLDQFKASGHANYFKWQLAKGKAGLTAAHYGDSCISCHSAVKMVDDSNAVLADFLPGGKYAGKDEGISCRVCHTSDKTANGAWTLKNPGWDACANCHTNGGAPTLGKEVHHPQGEFVKGIAPVGGTIKNMPSYKFTMPNFACYDCHMANGSHTFLVPGDKTVHDPNDPVTRTSATLDYTAFQQVFAQDKCKTCHTNPADMANKVKQQQEDIEKRMTADKTIYDDWTKKIAAMTPDQQKSDPKVKAFQNGATYYSYVEADGSKGAHNYDFAKALLDACDKEWTALK